jgi:hypothetical protein
MPQVRHPATSSLRSAEATSKNDIFLAGEKVIVLTQILDFSFPLSRKHLLL